MQNEKIKTDNYYLRNIGIISFIFFVILLSLINIKLIYNHKEDIDLIKSFCISQGYNNYKYNSVKPICIKIENDTLITREIGKIKGKYYFIKNAK